MLAVTVDRPCRSSPDWWPWPPSWCSGWACSPGTSWTAAEPARPLTPRPSPVSTVAALLHPDWAEIGRSGRLWTREEMLSTVAPLTEPVTLDTVTVSRVDETTILLLWRAVTDQRSTLRSSLWVRESGTWRQRFHQGTREETRRAR